MNVCIRLDSHPRIGRGHLARCLNLIKALSKYNFFHEFTFVGNLDELSKEQIRSSGYNYIEIKSDDEVCDYIRDINNLSLIVIDHYQISSSWEKSFFDDGICVIVIDDLNDRPHFCNILVDQTSGKSKDTYRGLVNEGCDLLIGPKFGLISDNYYELRKKAKLVDAVKKVLICFGGTDPDRAGLKFLKAIVENSYLGHDLEFLLITGGEEAYYSESYKYVERSKLKNIIVEKFTDEMAFRTFESDLLIGTGGISSYERCCLKKPAIVYMAAENQRANIENLKEKGAIIYLGHVNDFYPVEAVKALESIVSHGAVNFSRAASKVTDGRGCERVAKKILITMDLLK